MIIDRESLSVYLETSGPGIEAKKAREKFLAKDIEDAVAMWSGKFMIGKTTRKDIESLLGQPDDQRGTVLKYTLPHRPDYIYVFEFDPHNDTLSDMGYRRKQISSEIMDLLRRTKNRKEYVVKIIELSASAPEIRMLLGEPSERIGWWPIETWTYSDGITLNLRHGIVEEPTAQFDKAS